MYMKTILVAEDEESIREFININLRLAGYNIIEACDGLQAIEKYDEYADDIDIAVLDIMMPGYNGVEVCKHIRSSNSNVGIIFLTAKTQEHDKVNGLISGADDYITKPFIPEVVKVRVNMQLKLHEAARRMSEMNRQLQASVNEQVKQIARVETLYRRVEFSKELLNSSHKDSIILGDFELDLKKHVLFKQGKEIELTQIEYSILECLFSKPKESILRSVFVEKVWGNKYFGDDKVVDVNIRRLRLKVEDDPSNPAHLITVWGKGYTWMI